MTTTGLRVDDAPGSPDTAEGTGAALAVPSVARTRVVDEAEPVVA